MPSVDNAELWDDAMTSVWSVSDAPQTVNHGPENIAHVSASDRDALPSRQDAYKNEGQNTELILEHMIALRAQNELLHQEVNTLISGCREIRAHSELLCQLLNTFINERQEDRAMLELLLKNQIMAADDRQSLHVGFIIIITYLVHLNMAVKNLKNNKE